MAGFTAVLPPCNTDAATGEMWTVGLVNCGPKVVDRKCGHVGKMRTVILRTFGLRTKRK